MRQSIEILTVKNIIPISLKGFSQVMLMENALSGGTNPIRHHNPLTHTRFDGTYLLYLSEH